MLLAQDQQGYANLCKIISVRAGAVGSERTRRAAEDPVAAVAIAPQGLFALSDDPAVIAALLAAGAVAAADLRLLLVRPGARDEGPVRAAAARLGVALVADPELCMLARGDAPLQQLLAAMREVNEGPARS